MACVIPRLAVAVAVVVAVAAALYWAHRREVQSSGPSPTWTATPAVQDPGYSKAKAKLAALKVKGWERATDFERYRFGKAWSDDVDVEFGQNGCNTRDDILRRDLADLVVRRGTCYADRGTLNDNPRNLLAVSPKANFNKAFRDAASWLPPNEAFRCDFVRRQIDVKTAYGLWVAEKEKRAMAEVLERC